MSDATWFVDPSEMSAAVRPLALKHPTFVTGSVLPVGGRAAT